MSDTDRPVIINPQSTHQRTVIWLHGLGADANDFVPLLPQLGNLNDIKWIFPNAPIRPITINGGLSMRGWYDILTLDKSEFKHDQKGILNSTEYILDLMNKELNQGLNPENLYLVGFSQGGVIALTSLLQFPVKLGGVLALSTYLPVFDGLFKNINSANQLTPITQFHGQADEIIPIEMAEKGIEYLESLGFKIHFNIYNMGHSLCPEEIIDIKNWFK